MKETLTKHNFKFNKSFGQNSISDKNLLKAIVSDSGATSKDVVIEIGAGAGTLTSEIANVCKQVYSFEIDENLKPILEENLSNKTNVEILFQDIMKVDIAKFTQNFDNGYIVIANLPYYITTPIIFKFLESKTNLKSFTIMVQKEVAERVVAKSGSSEYGTLSILLNYFGSTKITRIVKKNMFMPMPKVDSAILHIDLQDKKYFAKDENTLLELVKSAFSNRRKTLLNNLESEMHIPKNVSLRMLEAMGKNATIRGETLSVAEFVSLSDKIFEYRTK